MYGADAKPETRAENCFRTAGNRVAVTLTAALQPRETAKVTELLSARLKLTDQTGP